MKMLYTANGRYIRCCTAEGTRPVIIVCEKEYEVDVQEFMVWSILNWRILREEEIGSYYEKMANHTNVTIHRSWQDCVQRLLVLLHHIPEKLLHLHLSFPPALLFRRCHHNLQRLYIRPGANFDRVSTAQDFQIAAVLARHLGDGVGRHPQPERRSLRKPLSLAKRLF